MPFKKIIQSDSGHDAHPTASTLYFGKSESGKMVRIYDKGLQVLGRLKAEDLQAYRDIGVITADAAAEGENIEEWTRVELVYTDIKHRPLVQELISDPDSYFAGGYPILAKLLSQATSIRPSYIPRTDECEVAKLMDACKASYGGLIYFLRHELGRDDEWIVKHLIGNKSAARLATDRERATVFGEGEE